MTIAASIHPADDLLHEPRPDVTNWSENLQVVVHDGRSRVGIYVHLGRQTDDAEIWEGILGVYLPDGSVRVSRTHLRAPDLGVATSGPLSFRPVEPLRRWRCEFDGMARITTREETAAAPLSEGPLEPLGLALDVEGVSDVWGVGSGSSGDAAAALHDQDWASIHLEQVCRITGHVDVGCQELAIDNVGFRDHSVGPRDFTTLTDEFWSCCAFPSGRAFMGLQVVQSDRDEPFSHGFVFDGGTVHDMRSLDGPRLTSTLGDPLEFEVRFASDDGEGRVSGHMLNSIAFSFDYPFRMPVGARPSGTHPVEGPARYVWDGEEGFGWIERIFTRPADGAGR